MNTAEFTNGLVVSSWHCQGGHAVGVLLQQCEGSKVIDRRKEGRAISMFRSAYVGAANGLHFVTLRNISNSGVCFDAYPGVAVGDKIEFCFDSTGPKFGTVMWLENGRFGVSAEICASAPEFNAFAHPSRSVRLPLSTKAQIFSYQGVSHVTVHNLSTQGICIDDVGGLKRGQLVTIRIADRNFELACVRWTDKAHIGIAFAEPVPRWEFRVLVDKLHDRLTASPTDRAMGNCAPAMTSSQNDDFLLKVRSG